MALGRVVLLVYGVLMLVGGVLGYRAARSAKSLIAGVASAAVLDVAWVVSLVAPRAGMVLGALVAAALSVVFGVRLAKTHKVMPSGALLGVSLVALGMLAYAAVSGTP